MPPIFNEELTRLQDDGCPNVGEEAPQLIKDRWYSWPEVDNYIVGYARKWLRELNK